MENSCYPQSVSDLPKIDLHRHLDGDVSPEVLHGLMESSNTDYGYSSADEIREDFDDWREQGFGCLLEKGFGLVNSLLQNKRNLRKVAKKEVENLNEQNIIYGEIRFAPEYHVDQDLDYEDAIGAVAAGLSDGEEEHGVKTNLIACIDRGSEPEQGVEIAETVVDNSDKVVALDLACYEEGNPPEKHREAFERTFDSDVYRTVHAGEFAESEEQLYENIKSAIDGLEADRLGHARTLSQNEDLINKVNRNDVGVELNPLSNVFCGYIDDSGELDVKKLLDENVAVSVNSDDPEMFGFTHSENLEKTMKDNRLNLDDYFQLQENAVETSFASSDTKKQLKQELEN